MLKVERRAFILDLISKKEIETQEEILKHLKQNGYQVTQATVSRDINQLKLVKIQNGKGGYKYSVGISKAVDDDVNRYRSIFSKTVLGIDFANNLVVVKCYVGMANAACAALDTMKHDGVVGTLSGDDTILIVMRTEQAASDLVKVLQEVL